MIEVILIGLVWLVAPFVELGIIIVLAISNHHYKKRIQELINQGRKVPDQMQKRVPEGLRGYGEKIQVVTEGRKVQPQQQKNDAEVQEREEEEPVLVPVQKQRGGLFKTSVSFQEAVQNNLGTIALIIGVVFVVLAGTIFATTTWHVMPDLGKALLVLAAALLFFAASYLAEWVMHIHKTGNGFYILGSVFLFIFCLATAYFKLLGPGFILDGTNRWRVLWVGSLVMEAALFAGLVRFHDWFYTQACLWGMTVSVCFMAKSFRADWTGLQSSMMLYSFALAAWQEFWNWEKKGEEEGESDGETAKKAVFSHLLMEGFRIFVPIHFWVFCGLTAFQGILGIVGWFGCFQDCPISLLEALAIGTVAVGIGYLAWKKGKDWYQLLFAVAVTEFAQYTAFCLPVEGMMQFFLANGAVFLWFWVGRKKGFRISSLLGDGIYTAFLAVNGCYAFVLSLLPFREVSGLLSASAIIILLALTIGQWARENRNIRVAIPVILWFLTITLHVLWKRSSWADASFLNQVLFGKYETLLFWFLCGLMLWDIGKRDGFCVPILSMGTLAQVFYFLAEDNTMPFALVMSIYLFLRGKRMAALLSEKNDITQNEEMLNGWLPPAKLYLLAKIYSLAGCYFLMSKAAESVVFRMTGVNIWFAVMVVIRRYEKEKKNDKTSSFFWDLCGCAAFLITMAGFYDEVTGNAGMAAWRTGCCLAAFYGYYSWFYREKRHWFQLLAVCSILPVPFFLEGRSWFSEDQIYAGTAIILLISGSLFRKISPILQKEEGEEGNWQIDWYHILAILILGGMAIEGTNQWCFWYLLLAALYFLQFAAVKKLTRASCFLASCCLASAFWEQPFIQWPSLVALELQLLPAAFLIGLMGPIWGKSRTVRNLQTLGYGICLALLIGDAYRTNQVADALMLEGICLAVFIWAQVRNDIRWVRISGSIILLVALFMTKEFWLSISWWVYLLAAGIGLIIFAAVNEKKKNK